MSDLHAKLLIIQADLDSPAREVAQQKGIPILELVPQPNEAAGLFQFAGKSCTHNASGLSDEASAQAEDIALVLDTSETTSRPKIVPLTHRNICTSIRTICQSLQLTERDHGLHTMPMFHIGGLIDLTLSPLAAGGLNIQMFPGHHNNLLQQPNVERVAAKLTQYIESLKLMDI